MVDAYKHWQRLPHVSGAGKRRSNQEEIPVKTAEITYTKRYVMVTYLVFWCAVAMVAAVFLASGKSMSVLQWGAAAASWTPTIVLLFMFKKLLPETTVTAWVRRAFAPHIHLGPLLAATGALVATMVATVWIVALRDNKPVLSILNPSFPALASGLFFALIQGATGEESGWRGYLQPIMQERAGGVIKGSLMVGLIWTFWHTPFWFTRGLSGWQLAAYIVAFTIGNTSLAVIIGVCYHRCKNLAVPMAIHFVSNAIGVPYAGDLLKATGWLTSGYVLTAVGFSLWHVMSSRKIEAADQAKAAG